jgi:hypothetical protein
MAKLSTIQHAAALLHYKDTRTVADVLDRLAPLEYARASGQRGANLFNAATAVVGQSMGTNGAVVNNAAYGYSAPIALTPGVAYYGKNSRDGSGMRFVTFFNAAGGVMTTSGLENVNAFVAPEAAASAIISVASTSIGMFQLEVGAAASAFEPYSTTVFLTSEALRNRSVTGAKIANGAVTPAKTNFLSIDKNLFDKSTATLGYYLPHDGGVPVASATFDYSDFIAVTAGQTYYGRGAAKGMRFVTYFDANSNFMQGGTQDSVNGVLAITPPAGAAYVRISIFHSDLDTFQFERGAAQTAYVPYRFILGGTVPVVASIADAGVTTGKIADGAITVAKAAFFKLGKNLFNKATATIGVYISPSTGGTTASATFDTSDFIPVTAGQTYYGRGTSHGMRFVAYYNASKTLITDATSTEINSFTALAGAAFVRVSLWHTDLDTFQLEAGAAQTSYEGYRYVLDGAGVAIGFSTLPEGSVLGTYLANAAVTSTKIANGGVAPQNTSFLVQGKNLFDKSKATLGYFRGHDGSTSANSIFGYSDYIPVTPGQQLISNSAMRFTTFYSANKALVTGGSSTSTTTITVPTGVAFVIVTFNASAVDAFQLETGTASTAYEQFGFRFTSAIIGATSGVTTTGWNNKTWATLGDSITAGGTWQALAANALGLVVTNFGIGGTKISGAPGDVNAMCQDTRINAIGVNFDLISMMGGTNDWAQNVDIGYLDGFIGTASFDTDVMTVTAVLTGPPIKVGDTVNAAGVTPGTYIVSLGTGTGGVGSYNLSTAPGALAARRTCTFDPTTFYGALNTWADKAFARWPDKKLAVATTPYGEIPDYVPRNWASPAHNTRGLTTNDYADAIRKFAARRNVMLIDVALNGGWGASNIATAMGGSLTDNLHPINGSLAAKGIASAHHGALRLIEPL